MQNCRKDKRQPRSLGCGKCIFTLVTTCVDGVDGSIGSTKNVIESEYVKGKLFVEDVGVTWLVMRCWMAVGMSSGQSFDLTMGICGGRRGTHS